MRCIYQKVVAFLLSFAGMYPLVLSAQTLPLINYTIQNGLPEATVYAVYQDPKGYLWTGTQGGVCVFDGRQFHTLDSQVGLPDNHVTAITGSPDGRIYFGHRSGQLSFYDDKGITRLQHKDFANTGLINALLWKGHTLYVATRGNGLFCINFLNKSYKIRHLTKRQGLPSDTLNQFAPKNYHEYWLATAHGVALISTLSNAVVPIQASGYLAGEVTSVCQQGQDKLWCGTPKGLFYLNIQNLYSGQPPVGPVGGLLNAHINKVKVSRNGIVWVATNKGVAKLDQGLIKCYTKINGLLSDPVYDIIEDAETNIWFGQDDGLSCYKDSPFELYTHQDGLVYNEVYSMLQDDQDNYWVATAQGISVFRYTSSALQKVKDITTKDGLPDNFVYHLYQDSHKNIWISCVNAGAVCYMPAQHKFKVFSQANGLAGKQVISINEDTKGRIWMATLDSGVSVYSYSTHKIQNYKAGRGFISNSVWTIHRDGQGQLWFGTRDKGLVTLHTETDRFEWIAGQDKLPNHNFGSISHDSKGNLWIASIGDGIFKYNGKSFKQYGVRQGIKSNNPYFIFCDTRDQVWLGNNTGVDVFDPVTLITRNYSKNDGFLGIETNQNAVYADPHHNLWVGTVNGLIRYDNTRKTSTSVSPRVYITKKNLFFSRDTLPGRKLAYNQNFITFEYLGLSLSNADKIRYQYQLKGFSNKWSPMLTESRVSYANLPPGKYEFLVKAGYQGGNWSVPTRYEFAIMPPFYKTWWFILLACAALYMIVSSLYRYRVNQLLRLERVRNKIASDLHDDIGSALSSISIFSAVADKQLQQQTPAAQTREIIGHISHHSRAMLDAMDDIVWAVNPNNDHFKDLAVRMREFAIPLLEARDLAFEINIQEDMLETRIPMEARKNIFLIFKECINNLLKHSGCNTVKVEVKKLNHQMELTIKDNGKGFDLNAPHNRNGIKNLQKRATEIKGVIQIESQTGIGTLVRLLVNII